MALQNYAPTSRTPFRAYNLNYVSGTLTSEILCVLLLCHEEGHCGFGIIFVSAEVRSVQKSTLRIFFFFKKKGGGSYEIKSCLLPGLKYMNIFKLLYGQ